MCDIFTTDASDDDSDDPASIGGVGRGKKKDLWTMERDRKGRVILPNLDEALRLPDKKSIVRSFLTYTYRMFQIVFFLVTLPCLSHWTR